MNKVIVRALTDKAKVSIKETENAIRTAKAKYGNVNTKFMRRELKNLLKTEHEFTETEHIMTGNIYTSEKHKEVFLATIKDAFKKTNNSKIGIDFEVIFND